MSIYITGDCHGDACPGGRLWLWQTQFSEKKAQQHRALFPCPAFPEFLCVRWDRLSRVDCRTLWFHARTRCLKCDQIRPGNLARSSTACRQMLESAVFLYPLHLSEIQDFFRHLEGGKHEEQLSCHHTRRYHRGRIDWCFGHLFAKNGQSRKHGHMRCLL